MKNQAIILTSELGYTLAKTIKNQFEDTPIYSKIDHQDITPIHSIPQCVAQIFAQYRSIIFIGALGICIRSISPHINNKHTDPAIINIDTTGQFVISVLSGHVGGANQLTTQIAHTIGAQAVITTQSDNLDLWALDTLAQKFDWHIQTTNTNLNHPLTTFVNQKPTALLLDIKDQGTRFLQRTKPPHVDIYYKYTDIDLSKYQLLLAVTPYLYPHITIDTIYYHPKVLNLGVGCRKNCNPQDISQYIKNTLTEKNIAHTSIKTISTIELKKNEPLLTALQSDLGNPDVHIYSPDQLKDIQVPNPSPKVEEVTTIPSVAESTAIKSANEGTLILEKQKGKLSQGNDFTFAIAINKEATRSGHIEIVGAGPGDPDLISVKGRQYLEAADLILYAGSLVPIELTHCAKKEATILSSATMDLESQFAIIKQFYDQGLLVVRLHTGDPCIYGAIQEQMAFFDQHKMTYHITPGISSFQAAAAALQSQFTIPEEVQTIILTRGEGRTPMPPKEKLHLLARSQSTMCIFLSATIVDQVQQELLQHYPPSTPVAVCYKLTWKDEKIYRGKLQELSKIVKNNKLTLTTMIVVGKAIDNRQGLSRLYAHEFKHKFRK